MDKHKLIAILACLIFGSMISSLGMLAGKVIAASGLPNDLIADGVHIHYQGRLLDPVTGEPKADGSYPMLFGLYNVETGGSSLWSESKDVTVSKGIFSTLLGDVTAFDLSIFNGQDLWLGINVGADPQMSPRQPLAYVPYAIHADDAGTVDGMDASDFAAQNHSHSVLPWAFGYISQYSGLQPGSYHVDNALWNETLLRWEITLTGGYYSTNDITNATLLGDTGSCPAGVSIRTTTVDGKLLVYIVNSAGTKINCSFHFVSFYGQ